MIENFDQLKPASYNPRKISADAAKGLKASINKFGDLSGIVWNKKTGNLVCGHQRLDQLKALGATVDGGRIVLNDKEFPVRIVEWSIEKEKAANVSANNPNISGEFDDGLSGLLGDIKQWMGEDDFKELRLDVLDGLDDLIDEDEGVNIVEDDVPESPEESKIKKGDVFILGDHRLICGDSTDPNDVDAVMMGMRADMVLTDPPYGVSYVGKTKQELTIENDNLDEGSLSKLIASAFDGAQRVSRPGAYWYASVPAGPLYNLFAQDWQKRGILRQCLVWVKNSLVMGHGEYHYRHEPILFGWIPGERHKNPDRTRTSVWEFDRPSANKDHPTMKPVALWANAVKDGSRNGEIVFDPFLGSGTTIVACEQLGRKCFGIEIDPKYCEVIIKRWENLTGNKVARSS